MREQRAAPARAGAAAQPDAAGHVRGRRGLDRRPRRLPHPLKCFEQPLRLTSTVPPPPRSYIYCRRARPDDVFRQFLQRAQRESGWRHFEMDASHNPHITVPQALMAVLQEIVKS